MDEELQTKRAAIAAALGSADAEERRQGTSHLAELPLPEALPSLLRALGDADWRVRKEATFVASASADRAELVLALVPLLETSDDVGLRNAVVDVLAASGHAATAAISARIANLDADGRKLAVDVLGRSGDADALPTLEAMLADPDVNVRQATIEGIASLGAVAREPVRGILLGALDDADAFVRLSALDGLNELGVGVPWSRLEPFIDDPTLRSSALRAAARSDSAAAAKALAKAIGTARGAAFAHALASLAELADGPLAAEVGEALRTTTDATFARVVSIAAGEGEPSLTSVPRTADPGALPGSVEERALAIIVAAVARAPGAVDAAIRALVEPELADAARRALWTLGPTALGAIVAKLGVRTGEDTDDEPAIRAGLIEVASALAIAHSERAAPHLPGLLAAVRAHTRDREKEVAASALGALCRLGELEDLDLVGELLDSPAVPVAHAAERALVAIAWRFPAAARASAARGATADSVSLRAALILGAFANSGEPTLGSAAADLAFLAHAATSGDARTRRAAVTAVAELGGATALDVLGLALTDEEPSVPLAAARGLGRMSRPSSAPAARAADVLELVGRSRDPDLLAAAVRAMGEAASDEHGLTRDPRGEHASEMIAALDPLMRSGPSVVALAAVDALGRTPAGAMARGPALLGALSHEDEAVVRAAMMKLGHSDKELDALAGCLEHGSIEVRQLAAELLGAIDDPAPRAHLLARAAALPDRDVRAALEAALASRRRDGATPGP